MQMIPVMCNDAGAEAVGLRYANRAARMLGTYAPEPFVRELAGQPPSDCCKQPRTASCTVPPLQSFLGCGVVQVNVMEEVDEEPDKPDQLINFAMVGIYSRLLRRGAGNSARSKPLSAGAGRNSCEKPAEV